MIKDIVSCINEHHHYRVNAKYWGRIGAMYKRYGQDILEEAITSIKEGEIPIIDFLNILERRCQFIIENGGEMDELSKMIFGDD